MFNIGKVEENLRGGVEAAIQASPRPKRPYFTSG